MTPERWGLVKQWFDAALATPDIKSRHVILAGAPPDVVAEVTRLLDLHERAGGFLSQAPSVAGRLRDSGETLPPGSLLAGRFEIRRLVGQGGMGRVYEAHDTVLRQTVAVKTVNQTAGPERFLVEVQAARQVTHPNVCRIFDIERDGDLVFCTMEFLDGETLAAGIRLGKFAAPDLIGVARQLCAGLSAAHDAGILHRDLKPANVILCRGSRAVLTDFGLALPIRQSPGDVRQTAKNEVIGTLAYMAPEVLGGLPPTVRSDLYSLGVLLYEAATGQLPFESFGPIASIVRRAIEPAAPPRSLNPETPQPLNDVILACLAADPSKRPPSARTVSAALETRAPAVGRRTALAWTGGSVAALSLFAAGYRLLQRETRATGTKAVLLASIHNSTGDPRFDGMELLLRNQIHQSSQLEALSEAAVAAARERIGLPRGKPIDFKDAREIALRQRVPTLVAYIAVSRLGPQFSLEVLLEQPASRGKWEQKFSALGEQDLLAHARDAADWIRRIAGEPQPEIDLHNSNPEEITTGSWQALGKLGLARAKWVEQTEDSKQQAIALAREALLVDPDFPAAARDLADWLVAVRRHKEGYEAWERAIELSRRRQLNSRERFRIEASYYDDIEELDKAADTNIAWAATYPKDYLPHFRLGAIRLRQNDKDGALKHLAKAADLQPDDAAVETQLAYLHLARDEAAEARQHIRTLRSIASPAAADHIDGKAHFIWGRPVESLAIFERLLAETHGDERRKAALLVASVLAETGRYAEASRRLESLVPDRKSSGERPWRARGLIYLAELARLQAPASGLGAAAAYAREAAATDDGNYVQANAGILMARCGDVDGARKALAALEDWPGVRRMLRFRKRLAGEIALARHKFSAALPLLQEADKRATTWDLNDSYARALEAAGLLDEAYQARKSLAEAKAFVWNFAENALPGAWTTNLAELVMLARKSGHAQEAEFWNKQLTLTRQ